MNMAGNWRSVSLIIPLWALGAIYPLFAQLSRSPRSNAMVHQAGAVIVDGNNHPIQLRAVNIEGWLQWEGALWGNAPLASESRLFERLTAMAGAEAAARFRQEIYRNYITESDIREMARLGFNSVRIPINYRALEGEGPGWGYLASAIDWCERSHLYAIIDLHSVPGAQSKLPTADPADKHRLVWDSVEDQNKTVEIWRTIASRYKNRSTVAGYDLINEPDPSSGEGLVHLYQGIIQAIHSVDRDHMVFIEGGKLATDFSMFSKPLSDNQTYSFHMYNWFRDDRRERLAKYSTLSREQNVPLWVGEFGANQYEMIASTRRMFEDPANHVSGWAYWPWKMAPGKYPGLMMIHIGDNWQAVMDWESKVIPWPKLKPSPERAEAGMREFLEAVKVEHCTVDQRTKDALLAK